MTLALRLSRLIDRLLAFFAALGGWCIVALTLVVCYDVVTRYFGVPKIFGLTSTILQEGEYWLHSYAIVLAVGAAYIRQQHVRIDLIREGRTDKTKYWIEAIGCAVMLIPYAILGAWLSYPYAYRAFSIGEGSRSGNGIDQVWVLKSGLVILFVLIGLAGLSVFIKAVAGIAGRLPQSQRHEVIDG
ncbi:TRAP transporter small permease subunit [uncultured Marivita sp.]|uniref:TRAP transporter small permease subunit n=1 Tax=uncultured Marivita sp. TaxID=888080 RepID=UPI00263904C0|nr:TRAP transporter small permease subunit [uncultured Marivita sp.]